MSEERLMELYAWLGGLASRIAIGYKIANAKLTIEKKEMDGVGGGILRGEDYRDTQPFTRVQPGIIYN